MPGGGLGMQASSPDCRAGLRSQARRGGTAGRLVQELGLVVPWLTVAFFSPMEQGEWCESVVGDWLCRTYSSVQRDRKEFPDFRVDDRFVVEVTGLHLLESDGDTPVLSAQRAARAIIGSELPDIPFHAAYGPCYVEVEYDLPERPRRRVLRRELREALAPYARPGQLLQLGEPFLALPSGVRLGFIPRRSPGPSSPTLSIAIEMAREGCLPDQELLRAMERALRVKTPKAEAWRAEYPQFHCWLALVDRIGTCIFEDNRASVIANWCAGLSIPAVWDRVLLFVMADVERPAAQLVGRSAPYPDRFS